ncbi:MAG: GDSL-type esterase/lipase family protein [Ignavibacteriales bacterium]|nr:GDSL-type esterase/lipase family protein [Ignavibacteriales bacterium]
MKTKSSKNILAQACFYIVLISAVSFPQTKPIVKDTLRYRTNSNYTLQQSMFDIYKTRQADIVMLGNSLTHGAAWNELLGRPNVIERGITSDVLYGYESRISAIYKLNPKIVFIMGGLNDIYNWTPVEDIFAVYVRIISGLRSRNIIPVIQSTTYSAKTYAKDWGGTPEGNFGRNREVDKLNKLLSDYAKKNNIDYIDVNSLTAGKDGFLRPELSWDGIHFKADAYKLWAKEVEKVLVKHKL